MLIKRVAERFVFNNLGYIPRKRPYVFGVGLSKTGTTTLNEALAVLGHRPFHQPPIARTDVESGQYALEWPWWMSRYDAATDLTVAALFSDLREMFPNARFIYTWRDKEKWLDSCRRHFTEARSKRQKSAASRANSALSRAFYGTQTFDQDLFRTAYDRHEAAVLSAFKGAPSFLSWGLTEDPRWAPLCDFLEKPVPDQPFPFSNKGAPA